MVLHVNGAQSNVEVQQLKKAEAAEQPTEAQKASDELTEAFSQKSSSESEVTGQAELPELKHTSYGQFLKSHKEFIAGDPISAGINMTIGYFVQRGRESRDFNKIETGELQGKHVFTSKKEMKAYLKEHPEEKANCQFLKSTAGRTYVRDNAKALGVTLSESLETYQTRAEKRAAKKAQAEEA